MPSTLRWFLLLSLLSLVSGCGFHLRGAMELPQDMERLRITGNTNSPFYYELERALIAAGGQVVKSAEAVTATLSIQGERYGRRVLTVDSTGRASEYELSMRVTYSLSAPDGTELISSDEVSLRRDYRFNPGNVLASEAQEETLRDEMRRQAARQILRRLQRAEHSPEPAAEATPLE